MGIFCRSSFMDTLTIENMFFIAGKVSVTPDLVTAGFPGPQKVG